MTTADVQILINAIESGDEGTVRRQLLLGADTNVPINEKL